MKIKNLEIKKVLKNKAIALATSLVLASAPVGSLATKAEANTITQNYTVMNYFTNNIKDNIDNYLDKNLSKNNLTKLLGYYDTLYDYIYNSKSVRDTYFVYLESMDQQELYYLLTELGNEIYNKYKSQYYYTTTCKEVLGSTLQYNSSYNTGYNYEHESTMEYYRETLDKQLDKILSNNISQNNLRNALEIYAKLVKFVQGNTRKNGYVFGELTQVEQEQIINLITNWTYNIMETYEYQNYYSSTCVNKVGWTVTIDNLYQELGEYMNYGMNNNINTPNNSFIVPNYPTNYPTYDNNLYNQNQYNQYIPPVNQYIPPVTNNAITAPQAVNSNGESINNTVGKDWHSSYYDPSIDTSYRNNYDFAPEYIDDFYSNDPYRYTQGVNGYYDAYGNFIPYNQYQYNQYNSYQNGYVEDYVPTYIP